jgi:hypothetical protein
MIRCTLDYRFTIDTLDSSTRELMFSIALDLPSAVALAGKIKTWDQEILNGRGTVVGTTDLRPR